MKNQSICYSCKQNTFDCDCSDRYESQDEIDHSKPKQVYNLKDINPSNKQLLADIRIISKNLIYVIGLAPTIANEQLLRKQDYFGQYGSIQKMIVIQSNTFNPPSHAAYITYKSELEASLAILVKQVVKASFGTTKYCTNFLKGSQCKIKECVYLHSHPKDRENTEYLKKEEMSNSKWLFTYSQKLARQNFSKLYSAVIIKPIHTNIFPSLQDIFDKMYDSGLIIKEAPKQDEDQWNKFNGNQIQQQIDHKGLEKRLEDIILNMKGDGNNSRFKFTNAKPNLDNSEAITQLKQYVQK